MDRKILHQPIYSSLYLYLRATARSLKSAVTPIASPEKIVVDVGCMDKPYEPLFRGRYKMYLGIDLNFYASKIDIQADASSLPFRNDSIDVVLCTESIEHFGEPLRVAEEMHRVLNQQGVAIFTVVLLFQKHSEVDYYRWTELGIKKLVSRFQTVDCHPIGNSITCIVSLFNSFLISLWPEKLNHRHLELLHDNFVWLLPKLFCDLILINIVGYGLSKMIRNTELISSYLVMVKKL